MKKSKKRVTTWKNRFQKFYHLHRDEINRKRRKIYALKEKKHLCVRCSRKAMQGITFCAFHRKKQAYYNSRR